MSDENQGVLDQDAVGQGNEGTANPTDPEVDQGEPKGQEPAEVKPEPQKEERPVYTMPVSKAQEEKHKAVEKARAEAKAEAEAEMAKLRQEYEAKLTSSSSPSEDDYTKELERVAEEHDLNPEAAKKLLEVFKKTIKVPDMSKYDQMVEAAKITEVKNKVKADIDTRVVPLIQKDNPNATPEQIAEIAGRVHELAFSEGYNTYKLEDIYLAKRTEFAPTPEFSVEGSKGRGPQTAPFTQLSDAEEHRLAESNPAEFARYVKWQGSQGSKYID